MSNSSNNWTPDLLKEHYDAILEDFRRTLEGFPELYSLKKEAERIRDELNEIKTDYVKRVDYNTLKDEIITTNKDFRVTIAEINGRRSTMIIAISVIVSIFTIMFGLLWKNQITHDDISNQIARESPWSTDRTGIENRIRQLETNNTNLTLKLTDAQTRLKQIESLDQFFCRTRQPKLAGC